MTELDKVKELLTSKYTFYTFYTTFIYYTNYSKIKGWVGVIFSKIGIIAIGAASDLHVR